ncbi:MAG: hypothetical protein AMJ62_00790 [Myxococcales bacterium SG8_38]|nr:MAG: hypothetical protein AMJ62_00790 [Myxococcales bacterium SG8_38]
MYFTPKKTIPPVAAAGLALAGCGDDSPELQLALDRMQSIDPLITAFCMKQVECYPGYYTDLDGCRVFWLFYADAYIQLADDSAVCYEAGRSYFECVTNAECGSAYADCQDEYAALESACYHESYAEERVP